MNVYRDTRTGRLVALYYVSPRMFTGGWIEFEDLRTKTSKKFRGTEKALRKRFTLVGVR